MLFGIRVGIAVVPARLNIPFRRGEREASEAR